MSGDGRQTLPLPRRTAAAGRLGPLPSRALLLARRSAAEFLDDDGPQLAAAISYHVLLSIFPLLILLLSIAGLAADQQTLRQQVLTTVTTYIPLSDHAQASLRHLLGQMQAGSQALGILGLLGLVVAATGMMSATRRALTRAWDTERRRSLLRGKLLDLGLVAVAADTHWSRTWPGALVGALAFQLLKEGFAFYLDHFAHYDAVYGSLGAAAAFIFFVYLSANAFPVGAEVASEYPRLP